MADKTIDYTEIYLFDNVPGAIAVVGEAPRDGFTGTDHHNVAAAKFQVGTKYAVPCDGTVGTTGWSVFTYLRFGTAALTTAMAVKQICVQESTSTWYKVTNNPDTNASVTNGFCAVGLSAMTTNYYGWFWTGGVCPKQYVAALTGTFPTDSTVVAASPFCIGDLTADQMGLVNALPTADTLTVADLTNSTGVADTTTTFSALTDIDTLTDSTGGTVDNTVAADAGSVVLSFPLILNDISAAGEVVTDIIPGFAGTVDKVIWVQSTAVTTGSKNMDLVVDVEATEMTGGLVDLDLDAIAHGAVVNGSSVTAGNVFTATEKLSVRAETVTQFSEGSGTLFLICTPTAVNDNFKELTDQLITQKALNAKLMLDISALTKAIIAIKVDLAASNVTGMPVGAAINADDS